MLAGGRQLIARDLHSFDHERCNACVEHMVRGVGHVRDEVVRREFIGQCLLVAEEGQIELAHELN